MCGRSGRTGPAGHGNPLFPSPRISHWLVVHIAIMAAFEPHFPYNNIRNSFFSIFFLPFSLCFFSLNVPLTLPFKNPSFFSAFLFFLIFHFALTLPLLLYTAGADYTPVAIEVVFSVGVPDSQELCYPVTLIDDDVIEEEENFFIVITSSSQGTLRGSPNITSVLITDNDGEKILHTCQ